MKNLVTKEKLFNLLLNRYPEISNDDIVVYKEYGYGADLTVYHDDMICSVDYIKNVCVQFRKDRVEDCCIVETIDFVIVNVDEIADEKTVETVEKSMVKESENYGTFSKLVFKEPNLELPQQHLVLENYEGCENCFSDFDELAVFCECQNFTDEECARELSHLLYDDVDLANKYLRELHPWDQETLYAFYIAARDGFNSKWKYEDDAPLALLCDGKKVFFAYSEEEKGE